MCRAYTETNSSIADVFETIRNEAEKLSIIVGKGAACSRFIQIVFA